MDQKRQRLSPKYRAGQRPLTIFVDHADYKAFTLLCTQLDTDKSDVVRSFIKRCNQLGKIAL